MTHPHDGRQVASQNLDHSPDYICALRGISVSFGDRDVLIDCDLTISAKERLAVLGDNGSGKSTLMRVIAGNLTADRGQREMNAPGSVAFAAQNPQFAASATIQQVIDSYHARFRELENLMRIISLKLPDAQGAVAERLMAQLQQVTDIYEAADGYTVNQRLDSALQQLGLGELDRDSEVSRLSGGQRSRLALACVLCSSAQLLLLDEPTNDLDEAALTWLERCLDRHRGAIVLITHDRMFLKRFARSILEVQEGRLNRYGNGYDGYLHAKEQERISAEEAYATWSEDMEHSRKLVEKNASRVAAIPRKMEMAAFGHGNFRSRERSHGSTSKIRQAKSRIEELEARPVPKPAAELEFSMPSGSGAAENTRALIQVRNAQRDVAPKLRTGSFEINLGERWLVTGPNGAGKTSLLKLLAGELAEDSGQVQRASQMRCAWLRQELGQLPGQSLIEAFALATDQYLEDAAEALAKLGLFMPEDFERHPQALSVGQCRRLELAIAVSSEAQVLFLDEPTNHISPVLVEQLESALEDYPGTVITVSHDRRWQQKLKERGPLHRLQVQDGYVQVVR